MTLLGAEDIAAVFGNSKEPCTRDLIAAEPETWAPRPPALPRPPVLFTAGLGVDSD